MLWEKRKVYFELQEKMYRVLIYSWTIFDGLILDIETNIKNRKNNWICINGYFYVLILTFILIFRIDILKMYIYIYISCNVVKLWIDELTYKKKRKKNKENRRLKERWTLHLQYDTKWFDYTPNKRIILFDRSIVILVCPKDWVINELWYRNIPPITSPLLLFRLHDEKVNRLMMIYVGTAIGRANWKKYRYIYFYR